MSHRDVTAPTGNAGIYGKVHFKNTAIGVVPIDADGNTWLVGQQRYTLDQYTWEIPEGGCPADEDHLAAAKRELQEETGILAAKWTPLLKMHTSNSVSDELAITYVAQELQFGDVSPDETELLQIKKMPLADAIAMAMDGEITDSLALVSLLKVQLLLDKGEIIL